LTERTEIDEQAVRALAVAADLPLPPERLGLVADQLAEWLTAANELSRKMSAPEHQTVMPATVFTHLDPLGGEE
jgi:hypothetical protein